MKAILKYPGSKWGKAEWITSFFPKHHSYLEPFFGSGAVLFNKERSNIETVNDLDNNVVNLFEWIKNEDAFSMEPKNSLEKALFFYIRLNMGHGYRTSGERVGWKNDIQGREKAYAAKDWCELPQKILRAAERLRGVQIENRTALELILRFNYKNVLIYCDPPYMLQTRHGKQYKHEMSDEDHEELLKVLLKHKEYVVLSGYDTDLYNDMLKGWNRYETTSYTQSQTMKQEVIWLNYDPPGQQLSLKM